MDTTGNPRLTVLGLVCLAFGAFGLLGSVFDEIGNTFLYLGTWGYVGPDLDDGGQFVLAILGGVMAGWGAMMLVLAKAWNAANEVVMRSSLLVGMGTWFLLDCTGSVLSGGAANLVPNTAFLLTAIWASRR